MVLDGEAVRYWDRNYRIDTQQGWEQHFAGSEKRLPTVGEIILTIKQLYERKDPALQGILQDLEETGLCTGLRIDYKKSKLPLKSDYVDILVNDSACCKALEDEVFQCNAKEAVNVLQRASGKRPCLLVSGAEGRRLLPKRAVRLYIHADEFVFYCLSNRIGNLNGRARGVRNVAAEVRAEETVSAYRDPAMTKEEELDQRIREILSSYDQLKSTKASKLQDEVTEKAVRELKGLYK